MTLLFDILSLLIRILIPIFIEQLDTDVYTGEADMDLERRIREQLRKEGWIK